MIAMSATIPNTLYLNIINMITKIKPIINAFFQASMESNPKLGPTVLSSRTLIGAGNEPALSNTAKSLAALAEKLPLILPWPPVIGSLICGALTTLLSKSIASL